MIGESSEFIVIDGGDYVKYVDQRSGGIEYTRDRDRAKRFAGAEWVDYWRGVEGVFLVYVNTATQQMGQAGAAAGNGVNHGDSVPEV